MGYPSSTNNQVEAPVTGDVDVALASIVDQTTSATYTYICEALPGTLTSSPGWRISRLTNATGVLAWANGSGQFSNIADNRSSLSYS